MIAIVDPFSSGRYLAPYFKKHLGEESVAVMSSDSLPDYLISTYQPADFVETIVNKDEDEAVLSALRKLKVTAVIAGSEAGVLLADKLSEALGTRRNIFSTSKARRDKFLMGEAIRSAGLRAVRQFLAKNANEAIQWMKENDLKEIVVKPKDSGATDGVSLCKSESEIHRYFESKIGKLNILNILMDKILVQEHLLGTEYVVDTVSKDGEAQVVAVWKYVKKEANQSAFVYDTMSLLTELNKTEEEIVAYTLKCLKALGIENGAAHNEVMLTSSGPCLIETGARIHGGNGTLISGACIGYNQIDRTAFLYADLAKFKETFKPMYSSSKAATEIFLISPISGKFSHLNELKKIETLPTYHSMTFSIQPGKKLEKTIDLVTSPGRVILIGSPEQLEKDCESVRHWENNGAYVLQ